MMAEFKSFEDHTAKLSEIANGTFLVKAEYRPIVSGFIQNLIADILLMRSDVSVTFAFNLNMDRLYFALSKSFPFIPNEIHEFIYPLDGSKTLSEVIDDAIEEASYYKSSLPIDEFKDLFVNIKAFDELFNFNGEFYSHMKKSSFSYTNIGHKDVFNGIDIVKVFGHSPGVSLKFNDISINVNNSCWIFAFDGVEINIKKEQFLKPGAFESIKQSVLGLYNLSKGTDHTSFEFFTKDAR